MGLSLDETLTAVGQVLPLLLVVIICVLALSYLKKLA